MDSSPGKEEKRALLFLAIPLRDFSTALTAPSWLAARPNLAISDDETKKEETDSTALTGSAAR